MCKKQGDPHPWQPISGEFVPEICKSRALLEHMPLIPHSSNVTEPTHTHVVRQTQMAPLLKRQQMRPHAKSQSSLQLCSA